MDVPVPAEVPPQLPVNHCHEAPDPKLPPFTLKVVLLPEQIVDVVVLILVGAPLFELTVITIEAQLVFPQVPCALTK